MNTITPEQTRESQCEPATDERGVLPAAVESASSPRRSSMHAVRWPALGAGLVAPLGWGVASGLWMPRGPLGSGQALWSIAISLFVGGVVGFAWRSRWAMLAAPVAFAAAVELSRIGVVGPTVDRPQFTTYGVLALVVGRGFHALVSWLPIVLGAAIGAGAARARVAVMPDTRSVGVIARRVAAGVAALGLGTFSILLVRPARTDPIVDAAGSDVADSIAEFATVDINGHDLSMLIRGHDVDNPVLLFLAGGPGGSEMGAMRNHLPELERHFTVVTWDQRGTGKSYAALDPTDTLTLEGAVDDTLAVTDHLRERFGQDRVYLLGQSWGSTLGVLAVDRQPELYRAFIGVGQMVSQLATDRIFYDDTLAWAREHGDDALADELVRIGPPPYDRMLDYETALSYEHEVYPYDHSPNSEGEGGFSENFMVEEYTVVEQVHLLAAFMDMFSVLYPQLQEIDFRTQVTRLDVPAYFVQGAHEAPGRARVFEEWFDVLDAPSKDVVTFDTSGHRPMFEQPDEFVAYMVDTVLAATSDAS
jgi:proline iminopeptidase